MPPSNFNDETTAEEAAAYFADNIKGKNVLITGATIGGLGFEVARVLAKHAPNLLVLAGRKQSTLEESLAKIKSESPSAKVRILVLDLASLEQVRKAAAEVNKYTEKIDVLINNAGIMACPYATTEDGFESQFGTNHLGPFLFTSLIYPHLSPRARVVNVSSWGHMAGGIQPDPNFDEGKSYEIWKAYGQAKSANILFSSALARKGKKSDLTAFSLHPGGIQTNLQRHVTKEDFAKIGIDENTKWKTLPQGSSTHIVAAFDPTITEQSGAYLNDCQLANELIAEHAKGEDKEDSLWEISEKLVGQKFEI